MSLLSDLNNKIKALSTRVAAQLKIQQSDIDSKVANVTLSGKTLTVTKGDGTSSTYTTTDTNTTYAAGTGLSLSSNQFSLAASGATAGSYGPSANASPAHKGTFSVPYITVDDTGRVTDISTKTITLPADNNTTYSNMTAATADAAGKAGLVPAPAAGAQGKYLRGDGTWQTPTNTDTKVTNTASNTTKFFITGTSSSSTNTGTQYFDTGVYVTATAGYLHCTRLEVGSGTIWVA